MQNKIKRLYLLLIFMLGLGVALYFVIKAIENKMVFFYSPTDIVNLNDMPIKKIRVGGMVLENSIKYKKDGLSVNFVITDYKNKLAISFKGILPDLFREKQGIIAEGRYTANGFIASRVLAKHDENYMPPEVYKALKNNNLEIKNDN